MNSDPVQVGFKVSATQNQILDSCQKLSMQHRLTPESSDSVCTVLRRKIVMKDDAILMQI